MARLFPLVLGVCAVATALAGCPPPDAGVDCLPLVEVRSELLVPDLIIAALDRGNTRIVGRSGAVTPETELLVDDEPATVDEQGAFEVRIEGEREEVTLAAARGELSENHSFRVRDLDVARTCAVGAAVPSGTLPNDIGIAPGCAGAAELAALVTLTGDGSLDVVDVGAGMRPPSTPYFPPVDGVVAAEPFAVATAPTADRAAVTLRGLGTVALVAPCRGEVLDAAAPQTADSPWLVVDVDPAVALREPRDIDGDGLIDTTVARMRVSGPQAAVFSGERLWVAYTNVLEPALDASQPMTAGPGALLVFDLDGDVLVPAGYRVLPARNPQGLAADGGGGVWVSATGVYAFEGPRLVAGSDGALLHVTRDLAIAHVIDAGRFAPGTPTVVGNRLVVGSTLQGAIAIVDTAASSLEDGIRHSLTGDDRLNTVFDTALLPGGLVGAVHFETDRLHVVDPATATLDPWPFTSPLVLAEGGGTFRGVNAIAFERWRGAVLLALSAEVVGVDLRQVVGP